MDNFKNTTEFQHHIKVVSKEPIKNKHLSLLVNVIRRSGPDHILKPVDVYDKVGETKQVFLRGYKHDDHYCYVVPLMRDLTEKESKKVVIAWNALYEGDYVLETSTPYTGEEADDVEIYDEETTNYDNHIIREFHNKWIKERTENGWRYGTRFDKTDLTHPMMLPWDQLPKTFKESYSDILQGILFKSNDL